MGLRSSLRLKITSCAMLMVFPSALFAGEFTPAAMVYTHGEATLNGTNVPRSSAVFSGDLIQTRPDSVANVSANGSSILILNDSLIEYDSDAVKVEHGGVTVSTTKSFGIRAGLIHVSPRANALTEFEVRDVDGTVKISARKGDLNISDDTGVTTTLAQGQETTKDDSQDQETSNKKKNKRTPAGAAPASNAIFDSPVAIGIAAGVAAGVTTWVLTRSDNPASPTN
jgi:hypothetical protein